MNRGLLIAGVWLLCMITLEVEGRGHVSVTFKRYRNPTGRKWNGKCCDVQLWGSRCRIKCNTYFKICLSNAPHRNSISGCSLANIKTAKMGHNNIYMHFSIQRSFASFSGNIGLFIEVWDWDAITRDDLIDKLSTNLRVSRPSPNGHRSHMYARTLRGRRSTLEVQMKVYCDYNYYGSGCTKYCKRSSGIHGHYFCDNAGNKVCYNNWYGSDCKKQCVQHDDTVRGHFRCDSNGNRFCRSGWYGRDCKKRCISYDDDFRGHYVCDSHGNKICRTHWHGNQCKTFCRRDGNSNFICDKNGNKICLDNWYGKSCTKNCKPDSQSKCDVDGTKICLPGWYGEDCTHYCVDSNDVNGHYNCSSNGTKVCLPGWYGEDCTHYCVDRDDLNGHYKCSSNGTKVCLPRWAAPDCKTCQEGFLPPMCNPPCIPNSNPRDGHYTCDKIHNKKCRMWWYGHDCQTYCVPHNDAINGHYTCGPYGQKQCILGWSGVKCTTPCFLDEIDNDVCKEYKKLCSSGSVSPMCNQCLPGYYGNNCSLTCLQPNSTNAGNIICNSNGKGNCGKWWSGKNCDAYCVPHADDVNGHYICDMNGNKRCLVGWSSPLCKEPYSLFGEPQ